MRRKPHILLTAILLQFYLLASITAFPIPRDVPSQLELTTRPLFPRADSYAESKREKRKHETKKKQEFRQRQRQLADSFIQKATAALEAGEKDGVPGSAQVPKTWTSEEERAFHSINGNRETRAQKSARRMGLRKSYHEKVDNPDSGKGPPTREEVEEYERWKTAHDREVERKKRKDSERLNRSQSHPQEEPSTPSRSEVGGPSSRRSSSSSSSGSSASPRHSPARIMGQAASAHAHAPPAPAPQPDAPTRYNRIAISDLIG